jgi:IS30 family transposase
MKKSKNYSHLSENEMIDIYEMHRCKKSLRVISERLKRSKSTVSVCLSWRPKVPIKSWVYLSSIEKAEYQYRSRLKRERAPRIRKLIRDKELLSFVLEKLTTGLALSPEDIAYLAGKEINKKLCAKTIYTFFQKERRELQKYLLEEGKPRRQRVMHRRGKLQQAAAPMRSITERPKEVLEKTQFGNFEGDLIQVKSGFFLSLREMKTRKQFFIPLRYKKAKLVRHTLIAFFAKLPNGVLKTITFDRGGEFAPSELLELERLFDLLQLYYCDAYCPYQKGSVENGHRWARKFIPRNSDFTSYGHERIEIINHILNEKPMKCLGRKTSNQCWQEELLKLAA